METNLDLPPASSLDPNKLSYEIFSILESKFLFGYDDQQPSSWVPKPISPKTQRGKVRVLSIDAGLSLQDAILVAKSLSLLERSLQSHTADPHARLSQFFDVAAGSGLGAVLVSMLFSYSAAEPLYHAADISRILYRERGLLWPVGERPTGCWPVRLRRRLADGGCAIAAATRDAERWLKEVFDERLTLKDTLKPVLIACYDVTGSTPLLFSRADAVESDGFDFPIWEVCRAAMAEPGRFLPPRMRSLDGSTQFVAADGGLAVANPTAAAITHVLHNKQEFPFVRGVEDLLVLSLGRGPAAEPREVQFDRIRGWRAKEWARPVRDITVGASAELVDNAVGMAFANARVRMNYVRVQSDRSGPVQGSLEEVVAAADAELGRRNVECEMLGGRRTGDCTNTEKLKRFAGDLVLEHRQRDGRIAPTVAFKQTVAPPPVVGSEWKAVSIRKM